MRYNMKQTNKRFPNRAETTEPQGEGRRREKMKYTNTTIIKIAQGSGSNEPHRFSPAPRRGKGLSVLVAEILKAHVKNRKRR